jgi:hypothetical protein
MHKFIKLVLVLFTVLLANNSFAAEVGESCSATEQCVSGAYCYIMTGNTGACVSCPPLYPNADAGSTEQSQCYAECPDKSISHGIMKDADGIAKAPNECEYTLACDTGYRASQSGDSCDIKTYTIKFNLNGGTGGPNSDAVCNYGQTCSWAEIPTKQNSYFNGWKDTTNNITLGALITSYTPKGNESSTTINLVAQWSDCNKIGALTYGDNCEIASCKVGYFYTKSGFDIVCVACAKTAGTFCPGTSCPGASNGNRCVCGKGWYCPGYATTASSGCDWKKGINSSFGDETYTGRCKCPRGMTTNETGNSVINKCLFKAGTNGTRLCDKNGCFNLKQDVPYDNSMYRK